MSSPRYAEKFKIEAVKQVTEREFAVADVASRIGVSSHSLYAWIKRYDNAPMSSILQDENRPLKAELRRVTEENTPKSVIDDGPTERDTCVMAVEFTILQ